MYWQVATGNRRTHQMAAWVSVKFLYDSTKSKILDKAKYILITTYNMTESIVCRTERANPAQSIALQVKGYDRF